MLPFSGAAMQLDVRRVVAYSGRATPRTKTCFKGSIQTNTSSCVGDRSTGCTAAAAAESAQQSAPVRAAFSHTRRECVQHILF